MLDERSELHEGYAEIGDVRLHYVEAGDGPLIVLLPGFPEFWFGWRLQIKRLAAAGFRVVAPDMRGYNLSSRPVGVAAYNSDRLAADVRGLVRERGAESALLVGCDWANRCLGHRDVPPRGHGPSTPQSFLVASPAAHAYRLGSSPPTQTGARAGSVAKVSHLHSNHSASRHTHDLRHSYATWLVDDGVQVKSCAESDGRRTVHHQPDLYSRCSDGEGRIFRALGDRMRPTTRKPGEECGFRSASVGRVDHGWEPCSCWWAILGLNQ
jgi:hypothetical protein